MARPRRMAAIFLGSFVICSESLANVFFAKGALGMRRSSPRANTKKKITRAQGKNLTMGNWMNFMRPKPIQPASNPIKVNEKMRAML